MTIANGPERMSEAHLASHWRATRTPTTARSTCVQQLERSAEVMPDPFDLRL